MEDKPIRSRQDKRNTGKLKIALRNIDFHVYNNANFVLGTPVALRKLLSRKGFNRHVFAIFIDKVHLMPEANLRAVPVAFPLAILRPLAGDPAQQTMNSRSGVYFTNTFGRQTDISLPSRMEGTGLQPVKLRTNWSAHSFVP
ncbi:hypothetical protein PG995_006597 [Apiospora arundinis]